MWEPQETFALKTEPQMNLTEFLATSLYNLIIYSHSRIIAETKYLHSQKQKSLTKINSDLVLVRTGHPMEWGAGEEGGVRKRLCGA